MLASPADWKSDAMDGSLWSETFWVEEKILLYYNIIQTSNYESIFYDLFLKIMKIEPISILFSQIFKIEYGIIIV